MNSRFDLEDNSFRSLENIRFRLKADHFLTKVSLKIVPKLVILQKIIDEYLNFHQKLCRLDLSKEEKSLLFALW